MKNLLRPVALGIDVEEEEDVLGGLPEIDVTPPHDHERVRYDQRQASFKSLEDGDGPEAGAGACVAAKSAAAYGGAACHI